MKLVDLVRVQPGVGAQQTRIDIYMLAETYAGGHKYSEAEAAYNQVLNAQRRFAAPDAINTPVTAANIGWVQFQQKRFADAEKTFRETADALRRVAPDSWERFNVDSMLGASLAAQRKFEQAEPLLISGYEGMTRSRIASTANTNSRFTLEQAGEASCSCTRIGISPVSRPNGAQKLKPRKNNNERWIAALVRQADLLAERFHTPIAAQQLQFGIVQV
jgi:tetratricopeptide (TPR) repeat protein